MTGLGLVSKMQWVSKKCLYNGIYTGLSKRNGAKLRESVCPLQPATAGHARLVLSKTVPFFCTTLYI